MAEPKIIAGDCIERMREMADGSVDAVVTDPPYGLEFMGAEWDRLTGERPADSNRLMQEWHEAWAREALRVLKPGGHLLAFGGTRTFHRLACAVEDAGFEVRDCLMWLYGSGFPKSLDVSKAIDKAARGFPQGTNRVDPDNPNAGRFKTQRTEGKRSATDKGQHFGAGPGQFMAEPGERDDAREMVPEAERWDGWGTALKPGWEPIIVARKPLSGTVAGNVLAHGTGGLNIDGCRIAHDGRRSPNGADGTVHRTTGAVYGDHKASPAFDTGQGRWPANVVLSHSEDCVPVGERKVRNPGGVPDGASEKNARPAFTSAERTSTVHHFGSDGLETVERWACVPGCPVRMLDDQAGTLGKSAGTYGGGSVGGVYGDYGKGDRSPVGFGDQGGPSRFFYCAKTSRAERNAGLDGFEPSGRTDDGYGSIQTPKLDRAAPRENWTPHEVRNSHPTVKPIDLMRWLVRLVTPPGGTVLDPFAGSGSTGCAAVLEGFEFVGIERDPEYVKIAEARIRFWSEHPTGLPVEAALAADSKRSKVRDTGQMNLLG